ncbi:PAS domain S-box protein [Leptolyngbya sp. FACHB-17]|uniref:PAS domain-containing sensor histidine kinase n=1 Tax=unclassified Leptolyngbya TaxID=2650499 RepID=UPI0016802336|nr:PAS domain S-box protein [Leptolyngbya sp. FACHB-17]MBD2080219.1 PAS domain S-box protein [Leptolyngbya sp. FACHB-17]
MQDTIHRHLEKNAQPEDGINFRRLVEAANDLSWVCQLDWTLTYISPQLQTLFGYAPEEWVGRSWMPLIHSEDFLRIEAILQNVIKTGENFSGIEFRHIHKDGSWYWVSLNVALIQDNSGNPIGLQGIVRDIDDRKATQATLQAQEQFLQSVYEAVEHSITIVDVLEDKEFRFVGWNPATEKITGILSEAIVDQTPEALMGELHGKMVRQDYHRCLEAGTSITYEEFLPIGERDFWWLTTLNPIKDDRGRICRIVATSFDITDRKAAETALQQAEVHYRSIFEAINNGISIVNLETGRVVAVNPAFCQMHGYTAEEFLQFESSKYIHADSFPKFFRFVETIQAGKQFFCEAINLHKDGTCIDIEVTAVPFLYNNQPCALSIIRDIRDRKAAETALQQAEAHYRSIFETINDGISIVDLETGKAVAVNPAFCQMHGYTAEELLQLDPSDYIHADSVSKFSRFVETVQAGEQFSCEAIDLHKDGSCIEVEVTAAPFLYNNQPCSLSIVRDIRDRKAAEQAQARLTAILEATSDFVGIADMQGTILYLNAAGHHLLEIPLEEDLIGFPIDSVHPPAASKMLAAQAFPIAIQQGIWQGESIVVTHSGCEIPVSQVVIAHKKADGTPEYFSTIIRNITAQKQAEIILQQKAQELEAALQELQRTQLQMIQAEKMSSLGQLVAGVAHEINNPVNFIYGNVAPAGEYIQDLLKLIDLYQTQYPNPSPVIQDKIEEIDLEFIEADLPRLFTSMKMGADRIRQIVHSLRTFSRLDEAACKEVDIHEGIDSTLIILENRFKAKAEQPAIEVVKQYGDLPLVECYAGQLNQVFMNVLANALDALEGQNQHRSFEQIKASPNRIEIRTQVLNGDRVQIRIADNGVGIPEAVKQRIFDPFFTTKPVGKGTGMGMSISYQIITENHGGTLQCFSTPGQGAEFVIEIPLRQQVS